MHSMSSHNRHRRSISAFTLVAILLAELAGISVTPHPAFAATGGDKAAEIVYLTDQGVIRVLDPVHPDQGEVQWLSPTGGWNEIALGDVNNDGDKEIIAISSDNHKLTIFDPVVASGIVDPNKKINNIPWDTLFQLDVPGTPVLVAAGNFDPNIPGDEICYVYQEDNGKYNVTVLDPTGDSIQPNGNSNGRNWSVHVSKEFDHPWTYIASGNIDGSGADDVVLVNSKSTLTEFDYFQPDNDFHREDGKSSDTDSYQKVAVGQIIAGGPDELAVIRSVDRASKSSLLVYTTDTSNLQLSTDEEWAFAPQPEFVFLADITGNGDKEVFFLRKNAPGGSRLIMRDKWGGDQSNQPTIELSLSPEGDDNGYQVGAGGDVFGYNRDEVIIMRDNNIRIYRNLYSSESDYVDYNVNTNKKGLAVGDLDGSGTIQGPQFAVSTNQVTGSVPTGTQGGSFQLTLTNSSTNDAIPFTIQDAPSWLVLNPNFGNTPMTITGSFNATQLAIGKYTATLLIHSPNTSVLNQDYPDPGEPNRPAGNADCLAGECQLRILSVHAAYRPRA